MIDIPKHWERLTGHANDVVQQARMFRDYWACSPPATPTDVESCESSLLDLRDEVNHLVSELIFLRGYFEGLPKEEVEERNDRGDRIIHITLGTAPCSEIAESLGISTAKVVALARRLDIEPAGEVTWELADGTVTRARSYDLAQWKAMRNELSKQSNLWSQPRQAIPPKRIRVEEGE